MLDYHQPVYPHSTNPTARMSGWIRIPRSLLRDNVCLTSTIGTFTRMIRWYANQTGYYIKIALTRSDAHALNFGEGKITRVRFSR